VTTRVVEWPDQNITIGRGGYKTPDGEFPRVTAILKVLGLGTEGLIKWSANEERKAVLEAADAVHLKMSGGVWTKPFKETVLDEIGPARQHQKQLAKAGEIGTAIHQAIHDYLQGKKAGDLSPEAAHAVVAFKEWWGETGLTAVRMEQPVWDSTLEYAGTIDLVAEHPRLGLGVVDFKSSKNLYDSHHLQVAAYVHAGSRWADLKWAQIVRLPKNVDDPKFEMKALGDLFDRRLNQEQLMDVFKSALTIHKLLVAK
jgi:hypothetical protein